MQFKLNYGVVVAVTSDINCITITKTETLNQTCAMHLSNEHSSDIAVTVNVVCGIQSLFFFVLPNCLCIEFCVHTFLFRVYYQINARGFIEK